MQYRETDFNFVSRLMEQYGIFYFFEHENGKHTLVLGRLRTRPFKPCPRPGDGALSAHRTARPVADEDVVTAFAMEQEMQARRSTRSRTTTSRRRA